MRQKCSPNNYEKSLYRGCEASRQLATAAINLRSSTTRGLVLDWDRNCVLSSELTNTVTLHCVIWSVGLQFDKRNMKLTSGLRGTLQQRHDKRPCVTSTLATAEVYGMDQPLRGLSESLLLELRRHVASLIELTDLALPNVTVRQFNDRSIPDRFVHCSEGFEDNRL